MLNLKSFFAAAMMLGVASSAQAAFTLTFQQVGANVVATGSGSINLAGLTTIAKGINYSTATVNTSTAFLEIGAAPASVDAYSSISGPSSIGTLTSNSYATAESGDGVGLIRANGLLFVPAGYVSGTSLSDSDTFAGQTFASLGITPGTYVFNFGGAGANADTYTVATSAVPEPTTLAVLGVPAALGLLRRRRQVIA